MMAHGRLAEVELRRNLPVSQAPREERHHLTFAWGERRDTSLLGIGHRRCGGPAQLPEQPRGHGSLQPYFAGVYRLDGLQQRVTGAFLQDDARRPSPNRFFVRVLVGDSCKHQYAHPRRSGFQLRHRVDAALSSKREIEKDEVRAFSFCRRHCVPDVAGFRDNGKTRMAFNQQLQPRSDHDVIVNDLDTDHPDNPGSYSGISALTVCPVPCGSTETHPPSAAARSASDRGTNNAEEPASVSVISATSRSPCLHGRTAIVVDLVCRLALLTPSTTI